MIDLDLELQRGAFRVTVQARLDAACTGIVGPSGSGKSSVLHALAGLLPVQRLRLRLNNEVVVDTTTGQSTPAHRRRIGLVFQDHRLFPHLTVGANLRYGVRVDRPRDLAWDDIIRLLDIGDLLDRRPDQCSGGQRQRVAIGRALLSAPQMLLLDEPVANLDRTLKRQILPYLRRLRDHVGIPILMVSHDLEDVLSIADDLVLLDRGHVLGHGALPELLRDPALLPHLHAGGLVCPLPGTITHASAGQMQVQLDGRLQPKLVCAASAESAPSHVGSRVEVLSRPDDVVLALPPVRDALSLSNRLDGRITHLTRSPERYLVQVDVGATRPILAELTANAWQRLGLTIGHQVVVLIKAQALQAIGLPPPEPLQRGPKEDSPA